MTKIKASKAATAVRKSSTKRPLPKGYGALRGEFVVRQGVDLTKPIYEQVLKLDKKERRGRKR